MASDKFEVQLATPEREYVKVYKDFLNTPLLSAEEKLIFIALKSFVRYGEDNGQIYPSMNTLCSISSLSRPRATRAISSLIKKGIVKKVRRGLTKTNLYTLVDNPVMWQSDNVAKLKEMAESVIPYSSAELIEELKRRGDLPDQKRKEPVSEPTKVHETSPNLLKSKQDYNSDDIKNQVERYTEEDIKELYDYDSMIERRPDLREDIDMLMNVLYDALNTTTDTIRISKQDKPTMIVISRLTKLYYEHLLYVLDKYKEQTGRIKKPKAYLLTQLYEAGEQMHFDISNRVNRDMAGD